MWEFMSKIVESSGVSGVLIVLAFILVTTMNENLIDIIESLNELTLLYAKLSNEKSKEEDVQ